AGAVVDRVGVAAGHAIGAAIVTPARTAQPRKARRLSTARARAHEVARTACQRQHDAEEPFHRCLLWLAATLASAPSEADGATRQKRSQCAPGQLGGRASIECTPNAAGGRQAYEITSICLAYDLLTKGGMSAQRHDPEPLLRSRLAARALSYVRARGGN